MERTYAGTLRKNDIDRSVKLSGWAWRIRDHGGVLFIDLRDTSGVCQVVCNPEKSMESFRVAEKVRNEFVITVEGIVEPRTEETINPKMETGEIEVLAQRLEILNVADPPPMIIEDDSDASEEVRLKYRYLDLRRPEMQRRFRLRHEAYQITRRYLDERGFLEIETPVLAKSTPEGARDFLVPCRFSPGTFYALPQSPQLFKQLFMVAGLDRYFQIVKCFRDEDLRGDRQQEFTQIDLEMSFADVDQVCGLVEGLITTVLKETIGVDVPLPLLRLSYAEAMARFGSDKPDTRFGLELCGINDLASRCDFKVFREVAESGGLVSGINLKGCGASFSRKEIDDLIVFCQQFGAKGMAYFKVTEKGLEGSIAKFFSPELLTEIGQRYDAQPGDLIAFVADNTRVTWDVLGRLRLHVGNKLKLIPKDRHDMLWVVDFPLFDLDEEGHLTPCHHPFTSPYEEDLELFETNPLGIRSKAYDLVLNGSEVGGGSVRIHRRDLQQRVFDMLGISREDAENRFGFFLEAFRYGAPPHAGLAVGFDRLVMMLTGCENIREVIAFPKTQKGICLMTQAPTTVDPQQLEELSIQVVED